MLSVKNPALIFTAFCIMYWIIIMFYNYSIENYISMSTRAIVLILWICCVYLVNKYTNSFFGWILCIILFLLLSNHIIDKVQHLTDPTFIETHQQILESLPDTDLINL